MRRPLALGGGRSLSTSRRHDPWGEGWRFAKPPGRYAPIDGVVALPMAHSALVGQVRQRTYSYASWQ